MTLRRIFCIGLLTFCAACGGSSPEPPTTGETKEFASVCDKANEGKRVAVAGFLRFPEKFTGTSSVVLRLYAGGDYAGAPVRRSDPNRQPGQPGWARAKRVHR